MTACVVKTADSEDAQVAGGFREAALPARAAAPQKAQFLRIPPFPGARIDGFAFAPPQRTTCSADELVAVVRRLRVGGTYWAAQPQLPPRYVLARSRDAVAACLELWAGVPVVLWADTAPGSNGAAVAAVIGGDCDPWHMLAGAEAIITEQGDEVRAVAAILGVAVYVQDRESGRIDAQQGDASGVLADFVAPDAIALNPFDGRPMNPVETAELCGFWRRLIDSNRDISGGVGFAFWKQENVSPLLWNGSTPFAFQRTAPAQHGAVAIWRSKTPRETVAELEKRGTALIEVEDGFLRSNGLGADCIPPLSLTVDRLGAYFDPAQPSELEELLQAGRFDAEMLARAREVRSLIISAGLGKYERGRVRLERTGGDRRHILVPGQVEDDRSVQTGGAGMTNIELLRRVREQSADTYILYKPHPDVVAGHRNGSVAERACLQFADQVIADVPISALIEMVDEVHVNTSLTGFEALMRDTPVATYGAPFYAGWGLTRDLGAVPSRRTARRTLDELVAATLLIYPRYLDPVTGIPCPAEVVVERLSADATEEPGVIVAMRRLQGRLMRGFRSLAR